MAHGESGKRRGGDLRALIPGIHGDGWLTTYLCSPSPLEHHRHPEHAGGPV